MPGNEAHRTNYSSTGVRALLMQKRKEMKGLYVFIKASDLARYQNMIDVLDEVMITNTSNYAMLDLDPKDRSLVNGVTP